MDNTLRFIGTVRSSVKERREMPALGAPAVVELDEEYAAGMLRMEKHSHFWVLGWLMARPEREVLQVVPRGVREDDPQALHGVFAVRSPARPNPIGMTAARLLQVEGLRLHFDLLDFLDGTPVVDLKPYFPSRDLIGSATTKQVGRPKDREGLRRSLMLQASHALGEAHGDVALGIRIVEHYRAVRHGFRDPERYEVRCMGSRPWLADTLMALTRVGLRNGMVLGEEVGLNECRYELRGAGMGYEETLAAADEELFVCSVTP